MIIHPCLAYSAKWSSTRLCEVVIATGTRDCMITQPYLDLVLFLSFGDEEKEGVALTVLGRRNLIRHGCFTE